MGQISFNGKIVHQGPIAMFRCIDGWNNSMAQYYPYIVVHYVHQEKVHQKVLNVDGFHEPYQIKDFTFIADKDQVDLLNAIIKKRELEEENKTVRVGKQIRVVRGRKIPIGTEGKVFWMGDKGFGMGVGIILENGSKVFSSLKNVEVMIADQEFERILLE